MQSGRVRPPSSSVHGDAVLVHLHRRQGIVGDQFVGAGEAVAELALAAVGKSDDVDALHVPACPFPPSLLSHLAQYPRMPRRCSTGRKPWRRQTRSCSRSSESSLNSMTAPQEMHSRWSWCSLPQAGSYRERPRARSVSWMIPLWTNSGRVRRWWQPTGTPPALFQPRRAARPRRSARVKRRYPSRRARRAEVKGRDPSPSSNCESDPQGSYCD